VTAVGGAPLPGRRLDGLSLAAFVGLGLPDGMLGAAWPSIRHSLGAPLGDLGLVLLSGTVGATFSSAVSGAMLSRLGIARVLALGALVDLVAAAGFALAPSIWLLISVGLLFGLAAGMLDSGLNTAIALANRRRLLQLLHGAYGVGTTIGPLVVTLAVLAGSWRPAYAFVVVIQALLGLAWWRTRRAWPPGTGAAARAGAGASAASTGPQGRQYRQAVLLGLLVFFLYTGLEVAAGQWEASYARGALHLSAAQSGLAVFGYWGALTVVRILLAVPRRTPAAVSVVRVGCATALVGAAVLWWDPGVLVSILALVVMGGALAGVFPALVALTPGRLGDERAQRVIGWQVGAANVGGSALSALTGALLQGAGLAAFGPALTAAAALLVVFAFLLEHLHPAGLPRPSPTPG
jgi:fucose permease